MTLLAIAVSLILAAAHLFAGRLRFLDRLPRSRWLSVAGGISVAYVFVRLLPELSEAQEDVAEVARGALGFLERHVYVLALIGLSVFYGLERAAKRSRRRRRAEAGDDEPDNAITWLSFGSYAVYNGVIGYVLVRHQETVAALLLFGLAMSVHFVVNDHSLREHHKKDYHRVGRWLLASAVVAGTAVGIGTEVSQALIGVLIAFIAGGVILNVMKEELPEERESSFASFAAGAAGYTLLLLAI